MSDGSSLEVKLEEKKKTNHITLPNVTRGDESLVCQKYVLPALEDLWSSAALFSAWVSTC